MSALTFDNAWREAVGEIPEPGAPLYSFYNSGVTRQAWNDGEPLRLLSNAVLPPPPPWTSWGPSCVP